MDEEGFAISRSRWKLVSSTGMGATVLSALRKKVDRSDESWNIRSLPGMRMD